MSDISENEGSIESEVEEEVPKRKKIFAVNNVPGLNAKLNAIQLGLEWVERLDTSVPVEEMETPAEPEDPALKAESDFNREMSFYNQALKSVTKSFKRLRKLGIPTRRPTDYLAEMAKSDAHMNKVREKLLAKQTAVERREQVRSIREQKKQGKKIQQEILKEKKSEKKKMLNALKKTKKGKMSADALLNDKQGGSNKPQKGKKFREFRDSKYGYGGKKKGSKWNTAESSSMSGGGPFGGSGRQSGRGGRQSGRGGRQSGGGGRQFGASGQQSGGSKHFGGGGRQFGGAQRGKFSADKKFGNKPRPKSQRRRR